MRKSDKNILYAIVLIIALLILAVAIVFAAVSFGGQNIEPKAELTKAAPKIYENDSDGLSLKDYIRVTPSTLNFEVNLIDNFDIAYQENYVIYPKKAGILKVEILTENHGSLLVFTVDIVDSKGNSSYNVEFIYQNNQSVFYNIFSGFSFNDMNISLPFAGDGNMWNYLGEGDLADEKVTENQQYFALPIPKKQKEYQMPTAVTIDGLEYMSTSDIYILDGYVPYYEDYFEYSVNQQIPLGLTLDEKGYLKGIISNVGTFFLTVDIKDSVSKEEFAVHINLKVEPKNVTVSLLNKSFEYNGNFHQIDAELNGVTDADKSEVSVVLSYNGSTMGAVNANSYDVKFVSLVGEKAYCYSVANTLEKATLTITARVATIEFYTNNADEFDFNLVYTGAVLEVYARVKNIVEGDSCQVFLYYSTTPREVENGIIAEVSALSNPNYTFDELNPPFVRFNIVENGLFR